MALQVNSEAQVLVRAPYFVTANIIEQFVLEKQGWLDEKVAMKKKQHEYLKSQSFERCDRWYVQKKREARDLFLQRIEYYEGLTGLKVNKLRLSSAKTRWGSCSLNGSISLVWRLVLAPIEIVDYVIVHEIMHIKHPNHSREFWSAVSQVMPDYKERRKWLKENGFALSV